MPEPTPPPINERPRSYLAMMTTSGEFAAFPVVSVPPFNGNELGFDAIGAWGDKEATNVRTGLPVPSDFVLGINYEGYGKLPVAGDTVQIGVVTRFSNGTITEDRQHNFSKRVFEVANFAPVAGDAHGGNRAPRVDYTLKPKGGTSGHDIGEGTAVPATPPTTP